MAKRKDIILKKGDTLFINFQVTDAVSEAVIDLTSWRGQTWVVTFITRNVTKSSTVIGQIELTNPSSGEGTLNLTPTDTNNFLDNEVYNLKIQSTTTSEIYTFLCGTINFLKCKE